MICILQQFRTHLIYIIQILLLIIKYIFQAIFTQKYDMQDKTPEDSHKVVNQPDPAHRKHSTQTIQTATKEQLEPQQIKICLYCQDQQEVKKLLQIKSKEQSKLNMLKNKYTSLYKKYLGQMPEKQLQQKIFGVLAKRNHQDNKEEMIKKQQQQQEQQNTNKNKDWSCKDQLIKRKKQKKQQLKKMIEEYKKKLDESKKDESIFEGIFEEYSTKQVKQQEIGAQEICQRDFVRKNEISKQQIHKQKQEKLRIFERVLKIYKNNWKIYFIKKYFCSRNTDQVYFINDIVTEGPEIVEMVHEKKIVFKNKYLETQETDHQIDALHYSESAQLQEELNKIVEVLFRNIRYLTIFHKVFVPDILLPYNVYIKKGNLHFNTSVLSKKQVRKSLISDEFEIALGEYQANLEILCSAIGHKQCPLAVFDETILSSYQKANHEIHGFQNSKKVWQDYLRQLRCDKIIENHYEYHKEMQRANSSYSSNLSIPGLVNIKSQEKSFPDDSIEIKGKSQVSSKKKNSDSDDDYFQVLE